MTFSEMIHTYIVYPFLIGSHLYSKDQGYFWCSSHHHTSLLYQSYHCRRKKRCQSFFVRLTWTPPPPDENSWIPTLCDDTYLHCLPILNWQSSVQQGSRLFLVFQPPSQVSPLSILPLPQKAPSPLPSATVKKKKLYDS